MPALLLYFLKLSLSLTVVYLFYRLVLQKHTFYNCNRWYLVGYTLLSFLIPFINITPTLEDHQLSGNGMIRFIPTVEYYTISFQHTITHPVSVTHWSQWDWAIAAVLTGTALLLVRLLIRYFSFLQIRRKATLISAAGMKIFQVDKDIIPFSFGNSIFINQQLHTQAELEEIIRHEFVHVKQKHTHDIIWGEIVCIVNWYNPFAWLLRKAIRQNLEFIADNKVLESGLDRKQYQYLLLKVIGNNHFSIANQFNFSSLKTRIAMMNKMKSARAHLFKFLFLLPLIAVMLLAFRNRQQQQETPKTFENLSIKQSYTDTPNLPRKDKGYYVHMQGNDRTKVYKVIVTDKNGKDIETIPMEKWNEKKDYYENLYGEILWPGAPPAPPAPAPPAPAALPPPPPAPPASVHLPDGVLTLSITDHKATVKLKDGTIENYDLNDAKDKAEFEKKYKIPEPPTPPTPLPNVEHMQPLAPVSSLEGRTIQPVAAPRPPSGHMVRPVPPTPSGPPSPAVAPRAGGFEFNGNMTIQGPVKSEPALDGITIIADSISWKGRKGELYLKGKTIQDDQQSAIILEGNLVSIEDLDGLVIIDGKKTALDKDYTLIQKSCIVKTLTREQALKKYGKDGKYGALEITTKQ